MTTKRGKMLAVRYEKLKEEIQQLGWLTHGSVTPNHPGYWRWTSKVASRTVTLALSGEQATLFREAIANHRKLEKILREMRAISRKVLLNSASGVQKKPRRKITQKPP